MANVELAHGSQDTEMREHLPYSVDDGIAARGAIALIVLGTDQTVEYEFRRMIPQDGVGFYHARIHNETMINPTNLMAMERDLAPTTRLIMQGLPLDVIAFGCTSATMVIGEEQVFARIHEVRPEVACTTPITAAFAAFEALDVKRLAVLTPYCREVNDRCRAYIEARGYEVPVFGSFSEESDHIAGRIDPGSVKRAAEKLARDPRVDAVFVSCTSLRVVEIAAEFEAEAGKPITSSNHAMAWHCLRLAGINDTLPHGRLLSLPA